MIEHMRINSDYPESGCWELHGYQDKDGYGKVILGGKTYQAHRYAYMRLKCPELTSEATLMHRCDNPPCWNPDHLEPGTQVDNVIDMVGKGRHRVGSTTLKVSEVRDMRELYRAGIGTTEISRRYNKPHRTVRDAVMRVTWKHIE
jgi:hypothetical protein